MTATAFFMSELQFAVNSDFPNSYWERMVGKALNSDTMIAKVSEVV